MNSLTLRKKIEVELWLENNGSVDSLVSLENEFEEKEEDDLEYFDTFPTIEELGYHKCLLKTLDFLGISRRKPTIPKKICNFVGRVRGLKVFVGNFTYECDFVMLEDTTSVIDHYLRGVILGKPFVRESRLVYDKGPEYKKDKSVSKAIQCLIKMKRRKIEGSGSRTSEGGNIEDNVQNKCRGNKALETIPSIAFALTLKKMSNILKRSVDGRKAHLLKDKQILSVGVFDEVSFYTLFRALGWHLEEIHVTCTQFRKKQTRFQLYTKIDIKRAYSAWRRRHNFL
nr:protein kinase-like domain, concanavalin A-like lectin/glucanase domain protein [Tanacetum cinerariifolium]